MFVTSGFSPNATDETSELPKSNQREYLGSFICGSVMRRVFSCRQPVKSGKLAV
jgi:hypothetical protein